MAYINYEAIGEAVSLDAAQRFELAFESLCEAADISRWSWSREERLQAQLYAAAEEHDWDYR